MSYAQSLTFYDEDDPNGTPLGTLTDEDCRIEVRPALWETGGEGSLTINVNDVPAWFTDDMLVKYTLHSVDTDPIFAFWLRDVEEALVSAQEQGGELVTFSGDGVLEGYAHMRLWHSPAVDDQPSRGSADVPEKWWWVDEPWGAVLVRVTEEGQEDDYGAPLADYTIDFTRTHDSDGVAWPNIDGEFEADIGTDGLTVLESLRESGELFVIGHPNLLVQCFQSYGRDLTGAFATDTVRLDAVAGNILTEIAREGTTRGRITHLLQRDKDGNFSTEVAPSWSAGQRAHHGYAAVKQTNDDSLLNKIAQETIAASRTRPEMLEVAIKPGFDPANGRYMPGPAGTSGHVWIGDSITFHTGTGPRDYNEVTLVVVGIRITAAEAVADTDADAEARSVNVVLELNYRARGSAGESAGTGGSSGPATHDHPPDPPLCEALTPGTETVLRFYPSIHEAADADTAESMAAPNVGSEHLAANWDGWAGNFEVYMAYDTPAASVNERVPVWDGVNAAAGHFALIGLVVRLGDYTGLLEAVQAGGSLRAQLPGAARSGIGISEPSQLHYAAADFRILRPSGMSIVGTGFDVSTVGSTNFPAQTTLINRTFTDTAFAAVPDAVGTDYLFLVLGVEHVAPTSGGTGASLWLTDNKAEDLPEEETEEAGSRNTWFEIRSTSAPSGSGLHPDIVGTSTSAQRCDHTEHVFRTSDPSVNDDTSQGYPVGTLWVNTETSRGFILEDNTAGAAVWTLVFDPNHTHESSEGSTLTIEEEDGEPSGPFDTLITPTGSLTDNADGSVSLEAVLPRHGGKEVVNVVASSGSSQTLDLADGNVHVVTLDTDCTFTFAGATNGESCSFTLRLHQDGTGGHSVTWPGSVIWPDGAAPTLDQTASSVSYIVFDTTDGGTTWYAFLAGGTVASSSSGSGSGHILITSVPAGTPLVFADLLQNSEGTDLLYASE